MRLFSHLLIVGAVLFGGDVFFNDAKETRSLVFDSRRAVSSGVKMQAYHFTSYVERKVDLLLPGN